MQAVADPGFANGGGARASTTGASIVAPKEVGCREGVFSSPLGQGALPRKFFLTVDRKMSTSSAF